MKWFTIFQALVIMFFLSFSTLLYSQVQVTQQQFLNIITPGSAHFYTEGTQGNFNIGRPGGSNTFDFTFLNLSNLNTSNNFQVSTIPEIAARFPGSAIVFGDSTPATIEKNPVFLSQNDSLFVVGEASMTPNYRFKHYLPAELIAKFPITYGQGNNQIVQVFDTTYNSNWQVLSTSTATDTEATIVDAYGILQLSSGNYECLRIKRTYINRGDKEFIYVTREGALLLMGGIDAASPDSGVVTAQMQLLLASNFFTDVEYETGIAYDYFLDQNYPNPFNPSTKISFSIPKQEGVLLVVYNSLGEKISELLNEVMPGGKHSISFDASGLPAGIYFYRIQSGSYSQTNKMVLLK